MLKWLLDKYNKRSKYVPNGIDLRNITSYKRNLNKNKIRILIESNSNSYYENFAGSFKIVEYLDKNKYEIFYLSNNRKPNDWNSVDKLFNEVRNAQAISIFEQSEILLKSSYIESYSYPTSEMMVIGWFCIYVLNDDNQEYLKDDENCLFYKLGNINDSIDCLDRLISDEYIYLTFYKFLFNINYYIYNNIYL